MKRNARYTLVAGLGAAALFHLAALGVWPEKLPQGVGENSGKMAVETSRLTPSQWDRLRDRSKVILSIVTFLTASPGSLQSFSVPVLWDSANNTVETIGAGGSGGAINLTSPAVTGGGGGGYSKSVNVVLTSGGTASYQIGSGGAAVTSNSNGNTGGDSWFNGTTFLTSSVGAKGGGPGTEGSGTAQNGGAGGAAASGIASGPGSIKNSGGRGGNTTVVGAATGGGGAAGPNGNGNNGVDISSSNTGSAGGSADAGSGGSGGAGQSLGASATNGGAGTEYDGSHGCGGGGGGCLGSGTNAQAGNGGNYGGGGGGASAFNQTATGGTGAQGLIVVTYTPLAPLPGTSIPKAVLITLIPPPPAPMMGGPMPLTGPRLTPPSGPAPQNPPFPGSYALSQPRAVQVTWIPPPPGPYGGPVNAQPYGPNLKAPPGVPSPIITLGLGRTQAPWQVFQAWDAVTWSSARYELPMGRGQFWEPRKLSPPISAPPPQRPPVSGPQGALLLDSIIPAWIPPQYQPITVRNLVPPISGVGRPNLGGLFQLFNQIVAGQNLSWCVFDLYTITLFNGQTLRFTTADFDINVVGNLFSAGSVRIDQGMSKTQAHWKIGFDVDTWTVVFMPRPVDVATGAAFPDQIGDVPWIQAAHSGYLDAADVQIDRAFFSSMPTWPMPPGGAVPVGTRTVFAGKVGAVDCTDLVVVLTINDYRDLFTITMPLNFYSSQCRHTLFDSGCNADGTMTPGRFQQTGVVKAGSTQAAILPLGGLPGPGGSGTYQLGTITMTGGANKGFSRTVVTWDGTTMKLVAPFPFAVNPGDTFSAVAGCDLQRATCTLFGNLVNFGGQPYIPAPEVTS